MNNPGTRPPIAVEMRRIEERYATVRTFLRAGAVIGVSYFAFEALGQLGGQKTDIAISLVLNVLARMEILAAVTLAGGAATWAIVERYLRRRKTEYLQGRIRELEERLDGKRTTSGLTPKGKTNPKDIRR